MPVERDSQDGCRTLGTPFRLDFVPKTLAHAFSRMEASIQIVEHKTAASQSLATMRRPTGNNPWRYCWCERGESNPHGVLPHQILSLARLPIPPLSLEILRSLLF